MLLKVGEKLFLAHRRLFEADQPRFFAGIIEEYMDGMVRVVGHSWTHDRYSGELCPKSELVSKIVPLASGMVITYLLPMTCDISELEIQCTDRTCHLVEGDRVVLDLTERSFRHA